MGLNSYSRTRSLAPPFSGRHVDIMGGPQTLWVYLIHDSDIIKHLPILSQIRDSGHACREHVLLQQQTQSLSSVYGLNVVLRDGRLFQQYVVRLSTTARKWNSSG